jgi:hypothetical protein
MKRILFHTVAVITSLVLTSCFQNETTIHLNKDGSGTVVEETLLGGEMLGMIEQMAALGGAAGGGADPLKDMFSEDKAKKRAAELGEGVTFEKSESAEKGGAKGARVTYRFKDINALKISSEDSMKSVSAMSPMGAAQAAAAPKTEPIRFNYAGGKLSVKMPEPKAGDEAADAGQIDAGELNNPEAEAMMKQMFADMKMSLKLVIEPGIAETNASHQDGNTITIFEMEMGKLMENGDNLKKLSKVDQKNPAAAMEALKGIPGVKFETAKELTVTVK